MNATPTATTTPGLWVAVTCPTCGGPVTTTNPGCTNGRETKHIVRCGKHGDWAVISRIDPLHYTTVGRLEA